MTAASDTPYVSAAALRGVPLYDSSTACSRCSLLHLTGVFRFLQSFPVSLGFSSIHCLIGIDLDIPVLSLFAGHSVRVYNSILLLSAFRYLP